MSVSPWDLCWLDVAKRISLESKDPSTKVGCVLTDEDNRLISTGVNGQPSGYDYAHPDDRRPTTIHAEVNALILASRKPIRAYVFPCFPCSGCMVQLAQHGVTHIYSIEEPGKDWRFDLTRDIAEKKSITLIKVEEA